MNDIKQKFAVIGLWYVWLPLMCAIEKCWLYDTLWFDIDEKKLSSIRDGICPIDDEQAAEDMTKLTLKVSSNIDDLSAVDIFIVCVPTPIDEMHIPNMRPLKWASRMVGECMKKWAFVVIESTINPWMCEEVLLPVLEEASWMKWWVDFELSHCPERISPGDKERTVYNINRNIGALTKEWCKKLADFYRSFLDAEVNEMATIKEAEATKIVENTFRDINIAYVNELAKSFDKMWIDLVNVIKWASNKPFAFLAHYPSRGVGWHCIAVDPYYLIEKAKEVWFDHQFLKIAREVNNSMPRYVVDKLIRMLNAKGKSLKGSRLWILGLSYKKNVWDMRESPALVIKEILEKEYHVDLALYDPFVTDLNTHVNIDELCASCEALIIATNHDEFVGYDFLKHEWLMFMIDGMNCLDKQLFVGTHIAYTGVGR